jgi:alkylated DNA repair dioxygenase AlkB|tara:strand:- start:292 stop:963 length:672 start_codon:yes stop_codon:yes gene_type:complete
MSFKKKKYTIIRQAISKDLAVFVANYFLMKKQVYDTCLQARYVSPFEDLLGYYEDKDQQIPNTYSSYADIVMETLLLKLQSQMEKATGLKLYPAYTYARIYKKGDILKRHKDRFSCEISTTMNLGGDDWPIYLEPDSSKGEVKKEVGYVSENTKGIRVDLKPGDMLVYSGCELEHWRNKFKGKECIQVFLHYNNRKTPGSKENMFDKRPHLGLPNWFKRNNNS